MLFFCNRDVGQDLTEVLHLRLLFLLICFFVEVKQLAL